MKFIHTRLVPSFFATLAFSLLTTTQYLTAAPSYYGSAKHYVSISMSGGYTRIFSAGVLESNQKIQVRTLGNGGAHLGVGYEYQNRLYWLSLGVEGQLLMGAHYLNNMDDVHMPIIDTQGKLAQMNYHINQHQGSEQDLFINVPLLFGYRHPKGFYLGGGLKMGFGVFAQDNVKMSYTTSATYSGYVDDFNDMPNHYYGQYETTNKEKIPLTFHGALIAELGYDVLSNTRLSSNAACRILRVGLFAEYGVISYKKDKSYEQWISPNPSNACLVTPHSFYNVLPHLSYSMPFYAGIKLTILLRMSTPHSQCNCY